MGSDQITVRMFKAPKKTNRWNKNQRVWIEHRASNFAMVVFKWRGNGRYVTGMVRTWEGPVRPELFKEIDVSRKFADRHNLEICNTI